MTKIEMTVDVAIQQAKEDAKRYVKNQREEGRAAVKQLKKNAALIGKLATVLPPECELTIDHRWDWASPRVTLPREALPALRKAIGPLHVDSKRLKSAEDKILTINLVADNFPGITFHYDRPLTGDATCQIVEQTSTYKTLVCRRD